MPGSVHLKRAWRHKTLTIEKIVVLFFSDSIFRIFATSRAFYKWGWHIFEKIIRPLENL